MVVPPALGAGLREFDPHLSDHCWDVAQLAEHQILILGVVGSIPTVPSILIVKVTKVFIFG